MAYTDIVGSEDLIGADDIIGADMYLGADDIAFGADPDMEALMSGADPDMEALMSGADPDMEALMSGAAAPPPPALRRPPPRYYPHQAMARRAFPRPPMQAGPPAGYAVPQVPPGYYPQPYPYPYPMPIARHAHARNAMMAQLAARNSVAMVERRPHKSRSFPLGFPETLIPPNSTASISQRPQVPFRGHRLFIPSDFAGSIVINDIRIGKNSQLVSSGPIPGRAFSEVGVDTELHFDTAQVSQDITLNITNISGAQVRFFATLFGRAVE